MRWSFRRREWLALVVILAVAGFLRLYRLDQLPPGLHYDEAFKGVMARQVIAGIQRPILFTENLTEEPMMVYATALSFLLMGESAFALRLVSAVAGLATVAALYMLARALFSNSRLGSSGHATKPFERFPRLAALVSAFVLAILYWHVNFSRLGMEPILLPLLLTLAFGFLWRGYQSGKKLDFLLGGAFLGGTQYTYKAALFVPILTVLAIGLEILVNRGFWTRYRTGLAVFIFAAVLVFSPLGLYFATHPSEFIERPSTVTVASTGPLTLVENTARVAGMFFVRGDENPRSNLPGRPVLDPFLALGFVAGLAVTLARFRSSQARFLLLWLGVMVLPSILTDFAPHFGRSIGAVPAIALLSGLGLAEAVTRIRLSRPLVAALLLFGLAFSTASTAHDYFIEWGERTGLFDSFDAGLLALAENLHDRPLSETLFISPVEQNHYAVQFGLDGREVRSFDGRFALVVPPAGQVAAYGIVTKEDTRSLTKLAGIYPDGRIVEQLGDLAGRPYASIFIGEGTAQIAPGQATHAKLGKAIRLDGYDIGRDGNTLRITLYWTCLAEVDDDYTVFVHLIGPPNPSNQSVVWAQEDARPGHGTFPTWRWRVNETIIDEYRLAVPSEVVPGQYEIEVGMYTLKTNARLPVTDEKGARMENDRVFLKGIALP